MLALLLTLASFQSSQAGEVVALLPPPPKDWRSERFSLPPDFAPEIELHGVEDLLFAPGMYAPDSDSYFSYALALRFDGAPEVDEAFLQHFLEAYYRGLCRVVGEQSHFTLDIAAISATVRRRLGGFEASVELFDPFVTGEALELTLELDVQAASDHTEVLGLASPFDAGAQAWKDLHALADAWRAKRPAAVFLNHAFAVPAGATFEALAGSDFLRTFALCEERTTVRADMSYTGLYLYGEHTYLEFLPPGAEHAEGSGGLAFGLERVGASAAFAHELEQHRVQTQPAPITRELDGKPLPWFNLLGIEMPSAPLSLFTLEYDPRFLAGWHSELVPEQQGIEQGGIARHDVLARYAAALARNVPVSAPAAREPAPFLDVSEVRLALDDAQCERLLAVCAAAGHAMEHQGDVWRIAGPQFRLVVRSSAQPGGVTGLELKLRRAFEHEPVHFGAATLSFKGDVAELELLP